MALHDAVLTDNDTSWDRPPRGRVLWSRERRLKRDEIIESHAGSPIWGFKDPRTLLLLDGWLEAIPDLALVGIFRHPRAVAMSLLNRNGFTTEKSLELWLNYNKRLVAQWLASPFPMVCFDVAPDLLRQHLLGLVRALDLGNSNPTFFREDLRRQTPDQLDLPPDLAAVYTALLRCC